MLNQSYAAIQQFQSQKKSTKNLQELKALLQRLGLSMTLEITSSSFWKLDWNLLEDQISGTFEVGVLPSLIVDSRVLQKRNATNLRIEEPLPIPIFALELQLLDLIKQSVESIC